ncbi:hypothetical protein B0J14DRAFT_617560 [Halenospora varia]|nr:hypothetical protein B0J14DRAFT_617560 [Halenospora varia]
MPRLVRRKPLVERIQDYLNPGDFWLWLSEEIETRDWDSKQFASPLALGLHLVFLIARANSGRLGRSRGDDVFGDDLSGQGWLGYIATFVVYILILFSATNAAYTFLRKRHYRLFESPIETPQNTPSAHRVRVDSSPVSSSPMQFLTSILGDTSAESRAHPDATRDVWEIAVWDPLPVCLRLFCLFSPGHVLVYWLFLPTQPLDPRPSMTVFTTILLQLLLSSQLFLLQSTFSQQEKDSAIIHKEVMSEYDIKYVHPRLNPMVRDVGTQYAGPTSKRAEIGEVETYTPTVILKRGFKTHPNPNYAKHVDPDNAQATSNRPFSPATGYTPSAYASSRDTTPFSNATPRQPLRQPQFRQSMSNAVSSSTSTGDGGSLGVYSHANSPLKKATSMHDILGKSRDTPRNSFDMAGRERQEERERSHSLVKRQNEAHRQFFGVDDDRRTSAPSALGLKPKPSQYRSPYQRMTSRF